MSSKEKRSQVSTTPNQCKGNKSKFSRVGITNEKLNKNEISCPNKDPPEKKSKKDLNYSPASVKPTAVRNDTITKKLEEEILCCDADEQEDPSDYAVGGFYPVMISDVFHDRYYVLCKLGWGTFSTVWLCRDLIGKRYVALKIVKSNNIDTKSAHNEIKRLRHVDKRKKVVQLLDDFKVNGVNGTHVCMIFEVLGHSILKLISTPKQGIPLPVVKTIIRQVGNNETLFRFELFQCFFVCFFRFLKDWMNCIPSVELCIQISNQKIYWSASMIHSFKSLPLTCGNVTEQVRNSQVL